MTTVASTFQPFVLFASGLSIESTHKVRLTIKSGTMKCYQAAWLTSNMQATDPSPAIRRMISGRYYGTEPYNPATNNPAVGTAQVVPFWVGRTKTFDQIAVDVTAAQAGSTIQLGIYGAGVGDQPLGLIVDAGAVDSSTTGFKTITLTGIVLQPGWHWLACLSLGAAPSFRANNISHPLVTPSAGSTIYAFSAYSATGLTALPAVWISATTAPVGPRILLRAL